MNEQKPHWLLTPPLMATSLKPALYQGPVELDYRLLQERVLVLTAALTRLLGDQPGAQVAIWGDRGVDQLAALIAAVRLGLVPLVVEQPSAQRLARLAELDIAALVATRRDQLPGAEPAWPCLYVDQVPSDHGLSPAPPAALAHQHGLALLEDEPLFLDQRRLAEAFAALDQCLQPTASDVLLVLRETSTRQYLLEALWALSRGLTVAFATCEAASALRRHLPDREHFPMDFSLFYFGSHMDEGNSRRVYGPLTQTARFADEHGFKAVWTPERHFNAFGGLFPNPSVVGAALAMITERIQIRCGSLVAPLHHPLRIAEDWSVVDNLSGGRVAMAFACGWNCDDFVFMPENYAERHAAMFKQIAQVRKLWQGEHLVFPNGMATEVAYGTLPRPIQPELPLWVTVSGKTETFVNAAAIGANILTHMLYQDPSMLISQIEAYRTALAQHGFDPQSRTVTVMSHTYLGNDLAAVRERVREPLTRYIKSSVNLIETMVKTASELSDDRKAALGRFRQLEGNLPQYQIDELANLAFERFFNNAGLLGTPESLAQMVRRLKDYGVDELACLIDFGLPPDAIMEGLTHLDTLRARHDVRQLERYRVTLCGTTAELLEAMLADLPQRRLPDSLRKLIVATAEPIDLPLDELTCLDYRAPSESDCALIHLHPSAELGKLALIAAEMDEDF